MLGSWIGAVGRALASHQCDSGSIPGFDVMWAEFVSSLLCSERFFSGYSSHLKPTFDLSRFDF